MRQIHLKPIAVIFTIAFALGSGLAPGEAHAEVLWNCGHEIHTSYDQGWVIIDYMSGAAGRDDIIVAGTFRGPNDFHLANNQVVHAAIRDRTNWGYEQSYIYIRGYPECFVWLR